MQGDDSNPDLPAAHPTRVAQPVRPISYFNDARKQSYVPLDYAGFGIRLVAFLIDGLVCFFPREGIKLAVDRAFGLVSHFRLNSLRGKEAAALGVYFAVGIVFQWLYGALLESSPKQGTLGKMICRIKVTDLRGGRVTFARATGRHFAKIPSALVLYLGFLRAASDPKHQAMHDQMADTFVLNAR